MSDQAAIINGKLLAEQIMTDLAIKVKNAYLKYQVIPKIAIILVGDNPASKIYVNNKIKAAAAVGIGTKLKEFKNTVSNETLVKEIVSLNNAPEISGIIVQLPLPAHINKEQIINIIDPKKDVDGFHPISVGNLYSGIGSGFIPCTALGCLELIKSCTVSLEGKRVAVVGRSNIVGRPLAALLINHNCTVTICHSRTLNLANITSEADIVISAVGKAKFLTEEYFNDQAIVIDVAINRIIDKDKCELSGDVDFEKVKSKVKYITPVPGGVGPMTVAFLLANTYKAMMMQHQ